MKTCISRFFKRLFGRKSKTEPVVVKNDNVVEVRQDECIVADNISATSSKSVSGIVLNGNSVAIDRPIVAKSSDSTALNS